MKEDKIIAIILIIEVIAILISGIISYNPCGNPCENKNIFNPFGKESEFCIQMCAITFSTLTYILINILIMTIIIYFAILTKNYLKRGKNENR